MILVICPHTKLHKKDIFFSSLIDFFTKCSEIQRASSNHICAFVRYKTSGNYQKGFVHSKHQSANQQVNYTRNGYYLPARNGRKDSFKLIE